MKAEAAGEVVRMVRAACKKPLMVKLSPQAENIPEMCKAVEAAGDVYKRQGGGVIQNLGTVPDGNLATCGDHAVSGGIAGDDAVVADGDRCV